jgi:hypothetical protein
MNITHQRCYTCKQTLPVSQFHKNAKRESGYAGQCKSCVKAYQTTIKDKLQTYQKEYQKTYTVLNKEKRTENSKRWVRNNRAKVAILQKQARERNPEKYAGYQRSYKERLKLKKLNEQ